MTTNTYQALCDSVGGYREIKSTSCITRCCVEPPAMRFKCPDCDEANYVTTTYKRYYEQSAEQRERLEELILNFQVQKDGEWYSYSAMNSIGKVCTTRVNALYSFIGHLIVKGVLSKEEVKEALCQSNQ